MLQEKDRSYLHNLVAIAISSKLAGRQVTPPEPPSKSLNEHLGAFVTLRLRGNLRGCIGRIQSDPFRIHVFRHSARKNSRRLNPKFPFLLPCNLSLTHKTLFPASTDWLLRKDSFPVCFCLRWQQNTAGTKKYFWNRPAKKPDCPKTPGRNRIHRFFPFRLKCFKKQAEFGKQRSFSW